MKSDDNPGNFVSFVFFYWYLLNHESEVNCAYLNSQINELHVYLAHDLLQTSKGFWPSFWLCETESHPASFIIDNFLRDIETLFTVEYPASGPL